MYLGKFFICSCIVSHCCSYCALQVFDKMPLRHFLTCLDFDEYQILGFIMFPHQEHVWFIGCVFNTPCPTCVFSIHWSCIAYSHLLHTHLLPLSCIGLYLVHPSMSCLPYTLYHLVCLRIEIYLTPLMHHYHWSYLLLLPSFLLDPLSIPDKKGESILQRVHQNVLSFLYDSCAHP